jgi:carbohydrate-selective porin OprB
VVDRVGIDEIGMPSKPRAADFSVDLDPGRVARNRRQANEIGIGRDLNLADGMSFERAEYAAQADLEIIADLAVAKDLQPLIHPGSSQRDAHRFLRDIG